MKKITGILNERFHLESREFEGALGDEDTAVAVEPPLRPELLGVRPHRNSILPIGNGW